MKKLLFLVALILAGASQVRADEGMWLPSEILKKIKDIQSQGFKLTAEDIYSVNKSSLKDAVVRFGGGCTGELISGEGLLITNHHCGFGQIQSHSSVEHNFGIRHIDIFIHKLYFSIGFDSKSITQITKKRKCSAGALPRWRVLETYL